MDSGHLKASRPLLEGIFWELLCSIVCRLGLKCCGRIISGRRLDKSIFDFATTPNFQLGSYPNNVMLHLDPLFLLGDIG